MTASARIIPAYAGSTGSISSGAGLRKDHPRIRGEHMSSTDKTEALGGSSPHTRGAHLQELAIGDSRRIIPAYAGSTGHDTSRSTKGQDHPRIRGEHWPWPLGAH